MTTTVRNKTQKPLSVPLSRGKVLHLGPLKAGEITFDDAELVGEAGDDTAGERKRQGRVGDRRLGDEPSQRGQRIVVAGMERELRNWTASDQRDRTFRVGHLEQQRARLAREAGEHLERIPPERERNEGHRDHV